MSRKEGSVGHNVTLNVQNAEWPEATIKIWNLIVQTKQRTTLNTMSTTNLAETNQKVWERCENLKMSKQEVK
jgi:hypothetical protein